MTAARLKPLDRQVVLITGGSSGIGLLTARLAAQRGARVMLVARNEAALREAVAGIGASGGEADYAVADVGELAQVRVAAAKAVARFGRIDTWVNNAGVAIYAKLAETPPDEHERLFRTNYFGVVNGTLAALEHMRERSGALITVGSIAGDMGSPVMGAYAASKHAVAGYIESLRIELRADGVPVSVTLIKPSGVATPIGAHAANHIAGEALVPPPVYDPQLVADAILDAAEHPRRDVTVGGTGRLLVLLARHFPGVFGRIGGVVAPFMHDPERAKTPGDNLGGPAQDGEERSRTEEGRGFSLYGTPRRRSGLAVAAGVAATAGLALLLRKRTR